MVTMAVCRQTILVSAMALMLSASSGAQSGERTVTGVVTDKRGNTLPQAVVLLENTSNLTVRSYITAKDGQYHFDGVNDDADFTLKARYRNYWSSKKTLSKFNSSKHPEVNLVIPID